MSNPLKKEWFFNEHLKAHGIRGEYKLINEVMSDETLGVPRDRAKVES